MGRVISMKRTPKPDGGAVRCVRCEHSVAKVEHVGDLIIVRGKVSLWQ
jgi:hypothetical protein